MNNHNHSHPARFYAGICLLVLLACATGRGHAQTIPNPSFEANTFTVFPGYISSNTAITGWSASPANRVGLNPAASSPFANNGATPAGTNVAFVQSTGAGSSLGTTITGLLPGAIYQVTFRANCRSGFAVPNPTWSLNGGSFAGFTASPAVGGANGYYTNSGFFTATGVVAALVLSNFTTTDSAVLVDNFAIANLSLVTTTNDSGSGSLRAAVTAANSLGVDARITFAPALAGATITLASQILITNDLRIDASSLASNVIIDGGPGGNRIFRIETNTTVAMLGLTLTGGNGGPEKNIRGGAIYNDGTLTMTDCNVLNNRTDQGFGGGILNNRVLYLNQCTIAGNTALSFGGGVNNFAATSVLFATNCTFSGNISLTQSGGGLANINNSTSTVVHCTFTGNLATNAGRAGGGIAIGAGLVNLMNSVVAGNSAPTGPDLSGPVAYSGANITNGNAQLGPLEYYGARTLTHPPMPLSPAIDAAVGSATSLDQRGLPRIIGRSRDLGAVEFGPALITLTGPAYLTNECHSAYSDAGAFSGPLALGAGPSAFHNLALKSDGTLAAWGRNEFGQRDIPAGVSNVVAVAGGYGHSLALKSDGTVIAWGFNQYGQTNISGINNVVAVSAGELHSLVLLADGTAVAQGAGENFVIEGVHQQQSLLSGFYDLVAVSAGQFHSLGLKRDGTVVAAGRSSEGQTIIPAGLSNVVAIAAGANHSLALKRDGTVSSWGSNASGQRSISFLPWQESTVVAIAAGAQHSLTLMRDGTVAVWGNHAAVPPDLNDVVAIAAGAYHSLALRRDGTVVAWGDNTHDQTMVPAGVYRSATLAGAVEINSLGVQHLNYSVTNFLGGVARVSRTVVVRDTIPPVLALSGPNPFILTERSYAEAGATAMDLCAGSLPVSIINRVNVNFPGFYTNTYSVTDSSGNTALTNRIVLVPLPPAVPGDLNGDGAVSQSELDVVYANYLPSSPWLAMTNVAGLGSSNVSFALNNSVSGAYSVEFTTNLVDWVPLGPATPRYQFTDTNAPVLPQRYYRLRFP